MSKRAFLLSLFLTLKAHALDLSVGISNKYVEHGILLNDTMTGMGSLSWKNKNFKFTGYIANTNFLDAKTIYSVGLSVFERFEMIDLGVYYNHRNYTGNGNLKQDNAGYWIDAGFLILDFDAMTNFMGSLVTKYRIGGEIIGSLERLETRLGYHSNFFMVDGYNPYGELNAKAKYKLSDKMDISAEYVQSKPMGSTTIFMLELKEGL